MSTEKDPGTFDADEYRHLLDDIEIADAMLYGLSAAASQMAKDDEASFEEKTLCRLIELIDEHFDQLRARAEKVAS